MSAQADELNRIARFLEVCGRERDAAVVRDALRDIEWGQPAHDEAGDGMRYRKLRLANITWDGRRWPDPVELDKAVSAALGCELDATAAPVVVGEDRRCWCETCRPITVTDSRMVLCPDCGNKRCPHANDHRNACTGSNEPGQAGSSYP